MTERVDFDRFLASLTPTKDRRETEWQQGEHVTLIGPTGRGKTTMALALLPLRDFTVIIGTKPRDADETLNRLIWRRNWRRPLEGPGPDDYLRVRRWPGPPAEHAPRQVVWPRFRTMADVPHQREVVQATLRGVFAAGSWCVFADDVNHLIDSCKVDEELKMLWRMGRSTGVSLVTALQRPRHAPLEAYDQATHLFIWRDNDDENVKRLGDLGGAHDRKTIRADVADLDKHEALYLNTRTGRKVVTTAEAA